MRQGNKPSTWCVTITGAGAKHSLHFLVIHNRTYLNAQDIVELYGNGADVHEWLQEWTLEDYLRDLKSVGLTPPICCNRQDLVLEYPESTGTSIWISRDVVYFLLQWIRERFDILDGCGDVVGEADALFDLYGAPYLGRMVQQIPVEQADEIKRAKQLELWKHR